MEMEKKRRGGLLLRWWCSRKKGELWHHKNETKCVTNSKAASFGSSGLTPLTALARCLISLGVDDVGVISVMVQRIFRSVRIKGLCEKKINLA